MGAACGSVNDPRMSPPVSPEPVYWEKAVLKGSDLTITADDNTPPLNALHLNIQHGKGVQFQVDDNTPKVVYTQQQSPFKSSKPSPLMSEHAAKLCLAAAQGDLGRLRHLLDGRVDVNSHDYDHRTALHIAAAEGNLEVVNFLLSRGANASVLDRWGHTPVDEASHSGYLQVKEALLRVKTEDDVTEAQQQKTPPGFETGALLCAAAATGSVQTLQNLLSSRADVNVPDYDGRTALHLAASRNRLEAVELLLASNAQPKVKDNFGRTPIDEAMHGHASDVLRVLFAAVGETGEANDLSKRETDVEELKIASTSEQWAIAASEVQFGKCISTTLKSSVYVATWRGLKIVAKTLKDHRLLSPEKAYGKPAVHDMSPTSKALAREELLHEIRTLSTLRHPDLVLFLGASLDTDVFFFMTEFMEGGDLETYMRAQTVKLGRFYKPPVALARQWMSGVARALSFLHACTRPIIHRDLKPLNLLLTKGLEIKVTDFGLSKIMRPRVSQTDAQDAPAPKMSGGVGTYRYMAPEVVRYEQYSDRIDIYSFALITYFVCTGRQPFHEFCGNDPELVLKAYLRGEEPRPALNAQIGTPELRTLIQDCWHKIPSKRPAAQECVERLDAMQIDSQACSIM